MDVSLNFALIFTLISICQGTPKTGIDTKFIEISPKLFDPTWESIDARPLPEWFDQSKIGIFVHWGLYSVPGFGFEWFWHAWQRENSTAHANFMKDNFKPGFTYQEFAPLFTAHMFDPAAWADIFRGSGAKYVVITSKHHEGYALWPSDYGFAWNSVDVGPHRDLLGDLELHIKNAGLRFGLYYSLLEWFHPSYMNDKAGNFTTNDFARLKSIPMLKELVNKYEPDIIWSDGEWEAEDTYWEAVEFLAWLYNDSPVKENICVNDRWGSNTQGKHGGFYNHADRFNPGVIQDHKFENIMTIDKNSWGYRRNIRAADVEPIEVILRTIIETVSCGGNIMINVGPSHDGVIPTVMEIRLLEMGEWLGVNGDAIYNTVPWSVQNDTATEGLWYTANAPIAPTKIYALATKWPGTTLHLGSVSPIPGMTIQLLGNTENLEWSLANPGILVTMPNLANVVSKWAYAVVINVP